MPPLTIVAACLMPRACQPDALIQRLGLRDSSIGVCQSAGSPLHAMTSKGISGAMALR